MAEAKRIAESSRERYARMECETLCNSKAKGYEHRLFSVVSHVFIEGALPLFPITFNWVVALILRHVFLLPFENAATIVSLGE